jgi:Helicase associated domain
LTEGIDVPAVDMVAFIDARRSKVDIAQATGRAMRKPSKSTKEVGYVVIPLFLDRRSGETLEEALKRSEFDEVANVLNAMQEQDDDLIQIIRELNEAKGAGKQFKPGRLLDKIEVLGPSIELSKLTSNIFAQIVDAIGVSWDESYGRLKAYKDRVGDCRVPVDHMENGFRLGNWVRTQRDFRYPLSLERRWRLDEIGFVWDKYSSKWESGFNHLKIYRDRVGDCRVPGPHVENGYKLGLWVSLQRIYKDKLTEDQKQRLDQIGFDWSVFSTNWERAFDCLKMYRDRVGHCHVPYRHIENGFDLGRWARAQRQNENTLSEERRRKLDELGFNWDFHDWEEGYSHLKAYRDREDDCHVPESHFEKGFALGKWAMTQRKRRSRLLASQLDRLESIGFDWGYTSVDWENGFSHLKTYKDRIGGCYVPFNHLENNYSLGRWVSTQRKKKNELSEHQIKRLDDLGFNWDVLSANWEKCFSCLETYRDRLGHCRVPKRYIENHVKLGRWVDKQRREKNNLSEGQLKKLDAIGFEWEPRRWPPRQH